MANAVELESESDQEGAVTVDVLRFGGVTTLGVRGLSVLVPSRSR